MRRAEAFYSRMKEMKQLSLNDPTSAVIAFDYQKNLPLPVTGAAPEYYRRQLWIHNFCIHDVKTDDATMFLYAENFAAKGPNDVISILAYYFDIVMSAEVKKLHIFADNCAAQNKNRFLWLFLHSQVQLGRFDSVSISYPIPGHSFLPCDRDFAIIEKKRQRADRVLVPSYWVDLVKNARRTNPFKVIFVEHPLTDNLQHDGTPVVRIFDYKRNFQPILPASIKDFARYHGILFIQAGALGRKTMTGDPTERITLLKRGSGNGSLKSALQKLQPAYSDYLRIKHAKYNDIKVLLERVSLPDGASFYDSIVGDEVEDEGVSDASEEV